MIEVSFMPIDIGDKNIQKIPHNLFVKLQAVYDSLKSAEKKAADLLLEEPVFFSNAIITEAAERAGCSEATLTRLAKKLGYSGYPELKTHLDDAGEADKVQLYGDITEDDSYDEVVSKVFNASVQALTDTFSILDKEQYKSAVDYLSNAQRVIFIGVGDAATVALSGYQKFMRINMNAYFSSDLDMQLVNISHLAKNDVVIAISHSGKTKSTVEAVKLAKTVGAKVISITNFPVSPLTKNSDVVLLTAVFTQHIKGEVMAKRVTELCLLESLFVNLLLKNRLEFTESIDRSNKALEINKL